MSIEKAIEDIQKKIDDFCDENGHHETDTNAFVFVNDESECYAEGLSDALNILERYKAA